MTTENCQGATKKEESVMMPNVTRNVPETPRSSMLM